MEFDLRSEPVSKQNKKTRYKEATISNKVYFVNSKVKAKHMVQVETLYGTKLGDVEKGLRILATLLYEAMGVEAMTYEEMLEYDLEELSPLLSLVS
jgi:hypothetical protein